MKALLARNKQQDEPHLRIIFFLRNAFPSKHELWCWNICCTKPSWPAEVEASSPKTLKWSVYYECQVLWPRQRGVAAIAVMMIVHPANPTQGSQVYLCSFSPVQLTLIPSYSGNVVWVLTPDDLIVLFPSDCFSSKVWSCGLSWRRFSSSHDWDCREFLLLPTAWFSPLHVLLL